MAAARRLGHANASVTTRHYARALDGNDEEIAAALDADRDGTSEEAPGEQSEDLVRQWHDGDDDDPPDVPTNGMEISAFSQVVPGNERGPRDEPVAI
jgi:hypothetical protein